MSTAYLLENDIHLPSSVSDPENRDPMKINKHLQLDFFNVIGEPDTSAYNFELLHKASHQVYHYSKIFIYRLLATLIGLPLMLCWGLVFGVYAFAMIWVAAPMRRLIQSAIGEFGVYTQTASDAVIGPVFRSMGQIYSNIRVSLSKQNIHVTNQIQV